MIIKSPQKDTFIYIFLILVLMLIVLPFITTFNDLLTRLVMALDVYKLIQNVIVPYEVRMVGVLLYPFGFQPAITGGYLSINNSPKPFLIEIAWNCIGWQSVLFFILTAWVGLQGSYYTLISKMKALMIGFLGTFLINLLRITLVSVVAYFFGQNVAIILHDYGSIMINIAWLFFLWWFVYSFVLEEKESPL